MASESSDSSRYQGTVTRNRTAPSTRPDLAVGQSIGHQRSPPPQKLVGPRLPTRQDLEKLRERAVRKANYMTGFTIKWPADIYPYKPWRKQYADHLAKWQASDGKPVAQKHAKARRPPALENGRTLKSDVPAHGEDRLANPRLVQDWLSGSNHGPHHSTPGFQIVVAPPSRDGSDVSAPQSTSGRQMVRASSQTVDPRVSVNHSVSGGRQSVHSTSRPTPMPSSGLGPALLGLGITQVERRVGGSPSRYQTDTRADTPPGNQRGNVMRGRATPAPVSSAYSQSSGRNSPRSHLESNDSGDLMSVGREASHSDNRVRHPDNPQAADPAGIDAIRQAPPHRSESHTYNSDVAVSNTAANPGRGGFESAPQPGPSNQPPPTRQAFPVATPSGASSSQHSSSKSNTTSNSHVAASNDAADAERAGLQDVPARIASYDEGNSGLRSRPPTDAPDNVLRTDNTVGGSTERIRRHHDVITRRLRRTVLKKESRARERHEGSPKPTLARRARNVVEKFLKRGDEVLGIFPNFVSSDKDRPRQRRGRRQAG